MTFQVAIKLIIEHEGGYTNDPDDIGGETNMGISKKSFPNLDIESLTQDAAEAIYYSKYWLPMKLDGFKNDLLKLHLFDMGVNAGILRAAMILQNILNVTCDGIIGPVTLYAANNYSDQKELTDAYIAARKTHYENIVKKNPSQVKFLNGWMNRVNDTTNFYEQNININQNKV
jgi:lysozyme family protein